MSDSIAPATPEELSDWLRENAQGAKRSLMFVGGQSSGLSTATNEARVPICLTLLNRVVDYPARDMTITVEAGATIESLRSLLATENQRLSVDAPHPDCATIGGAIAANTASSRAFGLGGWRDCLIGVTAVDSSGRTFHAGGRVVKNVAGYDLCKLLVGSRGSLAAISQVTLKVRPRAEATAVLCAGFAALSDMEQALQRLMNSATRPVAIEGLCATSAQHRMASFERTWPAGRPLLSLAFEGLPGEVDWQIDAALRELSPLNLRGNEQFRGDAAERWIVDGQTDESSNDARCRIRVQVLPSRTIELTAAANRRGWQAQVQAGSGRVLLSAPGDASEVDIQAAVREWSAFAAADRGLLTYAGLGSQIDRNRIPEDCRAMFRTLHAGQYHLSEQVKRALDPANLLPTWDSADP